MEMDELMEMVRNSNPKEIVFHYYTTFKYSAETGGEHGPPTDFEYTGSSVVIHFEGGTNSKLLSKLKEWA